jgi:hypothetical protein
MPSEAKQYVRYLEKIHGLPKETDPQNESSESATEGSDSDSDEYSRDIDQAIKRTTRANQFKRIKTEEGNIAAAARWEFDRIRRAE